MTLESHNRRQIEQLNQRGGRTLSIVDLIQAGTISLEMAAYAMRAMHEGASLLTAARPGGAGKTTVVAALLGFLPPEVPIITVDSPRVIREGLPCQKGDSPIFVERKLGQSPTHSTADPNAELACYLVHEIGAGDWYGYLWGRDVAEFFSLIDGRRRIASCLHADTLEELTGILRGPPLLVAPAAIGRVGLILFIHVLRARGGIQRRVATFWEADGPNPHRLVFQWDAATDSFPRVGEIREPEQFRGNLEFLRGLLDEGVADAAAVRRRVVDFYQARTRGPG
jgi:hypothetical protein